MITPRRYKKRSAIPILYALCRIIWVSMFLASILSAYGEPIEGCADGFIVQTSDHICFLEVYASGMKSPRLLALDFKKKSLLWEGEVRGDLLAYPLVFPIVDDRLITIEDDWLVVRSISTGKTICERDLWKCAPRKDYGNRKRDCNIYEMLRPSADCGIIFRQLIYGGKSDTEIPGPVDWIRIDFRTGRVVQWGEQQAVGLCDRGALLHDINNLFFLDQNGLQPCTLNDEKVKSILANFTDYLDDVLIPPYLVRWSGDEGIPIRCERDEHSEIYTVFFPGKRTFRTIPIRKNEGTIQESDLFKKCLLTVSRADDDSGGDKNGICCLKAFDKEGIETGRIENKMGESCELIVKDLKGHFIYLISKRELGYQLCRFLLPDLKASGCYYFSDCPTKPQFALSGDEDGSVLCLLENPGCSFGWFNKMPAKKLTYTFRLKFIDFNSGKDLWTYYRDVTVKRFR